MDNKDFGARLAVVERKQDAAFTKLEQIIDAIADSKSVKPPKQIVEAVVDLGSIVANVDAVKLDVEAVKFAVSLVVDGLQVQQRALTKPESMRGTDGAVTSLEPLELSMETLVTQMEACVRIVSEHSLTLKHIEDRLINANKRLSKIESMLEADNDIATSADVEEAINLAHGSISKNLETYYTGVCDKISTQPKVKIPEVDMSYVRDLKESIHSMRTNTSSEHADMVNSVCGMVHDAVSKIKMPKPAAIPDFPEIDLSSIDELRSDFDRTNKMLATLSNAVAVLKPPKIPAFPEVDLSALLANDDSISVYLVRCLKDIAELRDQMVEITASIKSIGS